MPFNIYMKPMKVWGWLKCDQHTDDSQFYLNLSLASKEAVNTFNWCVEAVQGRMTINKMKLNPVNVEVSGSDDILSSLEGGRSLPEITGMKYQSAFRANTICYRATRLISGQISLFTIFIWFTNCDLSWMRRIDNSNPWSHNTHIRLL